MNFKAYFAVEKRLKTIVPSITREELISEFTSGKKTSLKELSSWEYKEFIAWMNVMIGSKTQKPVPTWRDTPENRMRRKIIALFVTMGYKTGDQSDMNRINEWCEKYGRFHKPLNDHSITELTLLTTQVETYYASFLNSL